VISPQPHQVLRITRRLIEMIHRLTRWLAEPIPPPKWVLRWQDPANADWTSFGHIVGGRVRALDDDGTDSPAKRAWRKGAERNGERIPTPRWRWIAASIIVVVEIAVVGLVLYYVGRNTYHG
jgi:hypothetical protein